MIYGATSWQYDTKTMTFDFFDNMKSRVGHYIDPDTGTLMTIGDVDDDMGGQ